MASERRSILAGAKQSFSHSGAAEAWREYYRAEAPPAHPRARDFLEADLIAALERLIPEHATVLEAGSGSGRLLAALPNPVRRGIDYLPERVETARREHPEITFDVADAARLHLDADDGRRYDAVICDRLCHSAPDVRALLQSLRSRLSPGGRIYLSVFNYLWELPAQLAESLGWKRPAPISNWFSDYDFRNLFEMVGLEVVRFEDRLLIPLEIPGVSSPVNRYVGRLPAFQSLSLYRVYVLRARAESTSVDTKPQASVSVVVPARNEAGNILPLIERTPKMGSRTELIFVEGGSSDETWQTIQRSVAEYQGPLELSAYQQTGKGKGDAVRLGFSKATSDLLMILDADLSVAPEDLPAFYDVAVSGQADYVQGTRLVYPMEQRAMRFFNKLGNVAFSRLFTYLLQQPLRDTLCGTKVLWRTDYEHLAARRAYFGDFDPFGDFDLIFGAARLNLKIMEIPVRYRERTYGETNISRWKHGWLLLKMSAVAAKRLKFT